MSTGPGEQDVVELTIALSGLQVTVRGAVDTAADFVRHIAADHSSSRPSPCSAILLVSWDPLPVDQIDRQLAPRRGHLDCSCKVQAQRFDPFPLTEGTACLESRLLGTGCGGGQN